MTSIEKLLILTIFLLPASVLVAYLWKATGADEGAAEAEFQRWARDLDLRYDRVVCNAFDSDHDGYVSCTYRWRDAQGREATQQVECAGALNLQRGCRVPKPTLIPAAPMMIRAR